MGRQAIQIVDLMVSLGPNRRPIGDAYRLVLVFVFLGINKIK